MKLSEKRRGALYDAIHDPIMDARVELARSKLPADDNAVLFRLTHTIWFRVGLALDFKE